MKNSIISNQQPHPQLSRELWEALLNIHNLFFDPVLDAYYGQPDGKLFEHILRSFRTLDCWLDVAIREGWLD